MTQGVSRANWIATLFRDYLVEDEFNVPDIKRVKLHENKGENQCLTIDLNDGSSLLVSISRQHGLNTSDWIPPET